MTTTAAITGLLPHPPYRKKIASNLILSICLCLASLAGIGPVSATPSMRRAPFKIEIGVTEGAQLGGSATVPVRILTGADRISGFSFLIVFDSTVLKFKDARPSAWLKAERWQDFDCEIVTQSEQESIYPLSLLRISARRGNRAEPPSPSSTAAVDLAELAFYLIDDPKIACRSLPLQFLWRYCDDNIVFEAPDNRPRYVRRVYEPGGAFARLDTFDADTLPANIQDLPPPCAAVIGSTQNFTVHFINGSIVASCIWPHPEDLSITGDFDHDGVADQTEDWATLADLILREAVENASRRNIYGGMLSHAPDGTPLTLGSLVRLANPPPWDSLLNLPPQGDIVLLSIPPNPDTVKIFCQSTVSLGGILLVFDVDGQVSPPHTASAFAGMVTRWLMDEKTLRLIIFAHDGRLLPAGIHLLAGVPVTGTARLRSAAAVDRFGRPVKVILLGH
jgi:hypothetical protein